MPIKFPFSRRAAPTDAWTKCPSCDAQVFNRQLERGLRLCPSCGHHFRMSVGERIDMLLDPSSFEERDAGLEAVDPLGFHDDRPYPDRLEAARVKTGLRDAAGVGDRRDRGPVRVAIGIFDFRFMGGSMGSVVGEKLARCFETALAERIPAIVVSASGGARMQEGTLSLMQLAKTTAPLVRLDEAGVPFIAVLTDPTTGGVLASFASLGDVILAEPEGADRLRRGARRLRHGRRGAAGGLPDRRVPPRARLRRRGRAASGAARQPRPAAAPAAGARRRGGWRPTTRTAAWGPIGALSGFAERLGGAVSETIGIDVEAEPGGNGQRPGTSPTRVGRRRRHGAARRERDHHADRRSDPEAIEAAWRHVQLARHPQRPRTLDLVPHIFEGFFELHGDRAFGDDPAIVGGPALLEGRPVMVVGHQKGTDTESNIARNFGSPHPEGFRKAQRLMRLADKLGMPIVTFLDTAGAFPGPAAEERGQAEAIASSIKLMTGLQVPIVVVVLGEGGSGGALAIGVGDVVLALENSVYSVISPEGASSILWRSRDEARVAAAAMRMTAEDQLELGVVDAIIPEPGEGAHTDHAATARAIRDAILGGAARARRPRTRPSSSAARYARLPRHGRLPRDGGGSSRPPEAPSLRHRIGRILRSARRPAPAAMERDLAER